MTPNTPENREIGLQTPQETQDLQTGLEQELTADARSREAGVVRKWSTAKEIAEKRETVDQMAQVQAPAAQPAAEKAAELSDLADEILKQLEGKTDTEKIQALLNGGYDPGAMNEAMAKILKRAA